MKKLRRLLAVIMCVTLIAPLLPDVGFGNMIGKIFAAPTEEEFGILTEYTFADDKPTLDIELKIPKDTDVADYTWTWTVADNDKIVIEANSNVTTPNKVTLTKQGVGSVPLKIEIESVDPDGGVDITKEVMIHVPVKVEIPSTVFKDNVSGRVILKTSSDFTLVSPLILPNVSNMDIRGLSTDKATNGDLIEWSSGDPNVITVNSIDGTIQAVGAGITRVVAKAKKGTLSDYITVEVIPRLYDGTELTNKLHDVNTPIFLSTYSYLYPTSRLLTVNTNPVAKPTDKSPNQNLSWSIAEGVAYNTAVVGKERVVKVVNNNGDVIAVGAGQAKVTVKAQNNSHQDFWSEAYFEVPFDIKEKQVIMNIGDTYTIEHNALAEDGVSPNTNVEFIVSGTGSVVSVGGRNGIINALNPGKTKITVSLNDGDLINGLKEVVCEVIVIDGLAMNYEDVTINANNPMELLIATSTVDANQYPITWTSSDETVVRKPVAKVENGKSSVATITGLKNGTAIITATQRYPNGIIKTVSCRVTVRVPIEKMIINPTERTIMRGEEVGLAVTFVPTDVSIDYRNNLQWSSSDETILKLKEESKIISSAVFTSQGLTNSGLVIVTASSREGKNENEFVVYASCKVIVKEPVTGVVIPPEYKGLTVDMASKQLQLLAHVTPLNATNQNIKWQSSDPSKAKVDPTTGLVTFVAPGEVVISAISEENKEAADHATIYIRVPVKTITIDITDKIIEIGEKFRISYLILPNNSTNKKVIWSSSDPKIAAVDEEGQVTGIASGKCAIMVRTDDGGLVATCNVTVVQNVDGIVLDQEEIEIYKGETTYLQAIVTPLNATDKAVTWTSSNPKVATVSNAGKITGVSVGTVVITAKSSKGFIAQCTVHVIQPVTLVKMNITKKKINKGKTFKLVPKIYPKDATYQYLNWTSSNKKVAKVNQNGKVTAVSGGKAIISGTSPSGAWDYCTVTVIEKVSSVTMQKKANLSVGKSLKLKATVKEDTATNKKLSWKSSNTKVAYVNNSGKVTAVSVGKAVITAKAKDGSGKKAKCTITVIRPVSKVKLNRNSISISTGKSTRLTATVLPKNASIKKVTWKSSNPEVAEVDALGTITALTKGITTITATATDGSKKKASCLVTVKESIPVSSLTMLTTSEEATLTIGESMQMRAQILPANTNDRISWVSSNSNVVTVDPLSGIVRAKKVGTASITVMSDSGQSATCVVTVISMMRTTLTLEQYSNYTLVVEGATTGILWDVLDPEIATVKNGRVEARRLGSTLITAKVNGKVLTCRLIIVPIKP